MNRVKNDIEGILAYVKEYYAENAESETEETQPITPDITEVPFTVPKGAARPFVCVDGSFANLVHLQDLDANIAIFRVSTVEYQFDPAGHPVLARHHVFDKFSLVSTNVDFYRRDPVLPEIIQIVRQFEGRELDLIAYYIMYLLEQKALIAAAQRYQNAILARDGALTVFHLKELKDLMDEIIDHCKKNENIFIGVSKDSNSHYLDKNRVDEAMLSSRYNLPTGKHMLGPTLAARISPTRVQKHHHFDVYGDVYFARLHPFADKFFRVDVGTPKDRPAEIFGEIGKYCSWELTPGFPFPLVEVHKSAKAVRDVSEFYVQQIIETWKEFNIPKEVLLGGLLDRNGVIPDKFHTKLDLISRI